jgi:hypothetical protein
MVFDAWLLLWSMSAVQARRLTLQHVKRQVKSAVDAAMELPAPDRSPAEVHELVAV